MQPTDSKVIIIGGTSGIGLATARLLAAQAYTVTVAGRDPERCARVRADFPPLAVELCDASDEASLQALFERHGPLDHLVLSLSGGKGAGAFAQLDLEDLRDGFAAKALAQMRAAQFALPYLGANGSITFVTAISARAAKPGTAGLAAINGAVEAIVKPLARELQPLRVNAVSPGVVFTPWWDRLPAETRDAQLASTAAATPVGRNGTAEEIASAVAFVIANGFVTGTVIEMDGGLRLT